MAPTENVVLMVLRCWNEDGTPAGFRAHLTVVTDLSSNRTVARYWGSVGDVLDAVRQYLVTIEGSANAADS